MCGQVRQPFGHLRAYHAQAHVFGDEVLGVHVALDDFAMRAPQFLEVYVGIAFQPFQFGAVLSLRLAVVFLEFFFVRAHNLLFQVANLAIERAHNVHGFVHPIDQPFALEICKAEVTDDERNPNNLAAQPVSAATVLVCFLL